MTSWLRNRCSSANKSVTVRGARWSPLLCCAGQFTISVFRVSLVGPAAVEPTVFQVRGTK
ncbi:MAG: hypothetical protein R3E79_60755 [Caldilineaceae bacterium]